MLIACGTKGKHAPGQKLAGSPNSSVVVQDHHPATLMAITELDTFNMLLSLWARRDGYLPPA